MAPFAAEETASYRSGYRWLLRCVGILNIVILCLTMFTAFYFYTSVPEDRFFAQIYTGSKMPVQGLEEPNINTQTLLNWAATAATEIMTFGFHDIDKRFETSRLYFSPQGWESFKTAMIKSGIVENADQYQQIITSIPESSPTLVSEGIIDHKYGWVVDMRIVMTIRAGEKQATQLLNVRLAIVKMPTSENPMGLGIQTFMSY